MLRNALHVAAVAALTAAAWYNRAAARSLQLAHARLIEWRAADLDLHAADWAHRVAHDELMLERHAHIQRDLVDYQTAAGHRAWREALDDNPAPAPTPPAVDVRPGELG